MLSVHADYLSMYSIMKNLKTHHRLLQMAMVFLIGMMAIVGFVEKIFVAREDFVHLYVRQNILIA